MERYSRIIRDLKEKNQYRFLKLSEGIDLSSNDYLGLRDHPVLKHAAIEAIESGMPLGSGGSRLITGHHQAHQDLEEFAAAHYGFERALYFASGYSANYALFSSLPSRHDVVLMDSLIHACVKDGVRAPHAKAVKIPHNDLDAFEDSLKKYRDQAETVWIAVESVYSMDGDQAPLQKLYDLAQEYDAILVVDEAHGTGLFGEQGKGLSHDLPRENLITIHTCGKALGVAGGLICASAEIIEMLINTAMPFVFSTAPPPLQAYLTHKAIGLCASGEGERRRTKLQALCSQAQAALGGSGTQILPIILGENDAAIEAALALQNSGYDIRAIRPPTVPHGSARLRLSLNANLDEEILNDFIAELSPFLLNKAA